MKQATKQATKQPQQSQQLLSPMVMDLLYQSLETELGGVEVYKTALKCVQNADLMEEWQEYLDQTKEHVLVMRDVLSSMGLDPDRDTHGRQTVRIIGKALCKAMHNALGGDDPAAAELVAAECVTLAETKDHQNWSLLAALAEDNPDLTSLAEAAGAIEDEEDEHYYHTSGWARELWKQALGLDAQLPPPEEELDAQSMLEAAHAKGNAE